MSRGVFTGGAPFYGSSGDADEMCEGAMWLYKATGDQSYLNDTMSYVDLGVAWGLGWDDKKLACQGNIIEETKKRVREKEREKEKERERERRKKKME